MSDKLRRAATVLLRDIKTTPNINPSIVRRELEILVDEHYDPEAWEDFTPLRGDDRRDLEVE